MIRNGEKSVQGNCIVASPVKFNCWKHHAGFIKKQISGIRSEEELSRLKKLLLFIGESQMDLYIGKFPPGKIVSLIINELKSKKPVDYNSYNLWLKSGGLDYKLITINDNSTWTLRAGDEEKSYIHIHPARYSKYTARVRAATLKTVICFLAHQNIHAGEVMNVVLINRLRREIFNAPPIKMIKNKSGVNKLINLFKSL